MFTNMTSSRRAHGVTASVAAVWWTYLTRRAAGQDGGEALYCAAMGDLLLRRGVVDGRRRDVAIRDGRIHRLGVIKGGVLVARNTRTSEVLTPR